MADIQESQVGCWTPMRNASIVDKSKEKKATKAAADPAAPLEQIVTCTPIVSQAPMTVLVVGAGGNGARVIPPLTQMLRRRDRLFIMDHDIVEDRNLARQHFTTRDIGSPKALVLAQRYQKRDLTPVALVAKLTADGVDTQLEEFGWPTTRNQLVIMGCVDNNDAREIMNGMLLGNVPVGNGLQGVAYIDIGNERRGGQVLMSLRDWRLIVQELGQPPSPAHTWLLPTMTNAMPQLCKPGLWQCEECGAPNTPDLTVCPTCRRAVGTCGNRLDLQTVMVNHMAAGMALNCLSWLMLGIPFTAAGAFFSTLNTIQPIRIKAIGPDYVLDVDETFAEKS